MYHYIIFCDNILIFVDDFIISMYNNYIMWSLTCGHVCVISKKYGTILVYIEKSKCEVLLCQYGTHYCALSHWFHIFCYGVAFASFNIYIYIGNIRCCCVRAFVTINVIMLPKMLQYMYVASNGFISTYYIYCKCLIICILNDPRLILKIDEAYDDYIVALFST